jgi:hypothetical protein
MSDVEPSGVPWPHRRSHPQAEPTAPSDNPAGEEGIMAQPERVDMLVLGSGAAGKLLAGHRAHAGSRTAVVERQLIGGSCPKTNGLPSTHEIWRVLSDFAPNWLFGMGCETVAPSPGE